MSGAELASKIHDYKELKALSAQIADEMNAIEDAIKAEMTLRNVEELTVDVDKVTWRTVRSSRFDAVAFRKAMPDVAELYTKLSVIRRFLIG